MYIYIYIHIERERDIHLYLYVYVLEPFRSPAWSADAPGRPAGRATVRFSLKSRGRNMELRKPEFDICLRNVCGCFAENLVFPGPAPGNLAQAGATTDDNLGDRVFWETCGPGNTRSGKTVAIWSHRHCKPAACTLGLTGANMRISLMIWSSDKVKRSKCQSQRLRIVACRELETSFKKLKA